MKILVPTKRVVDTDQRIRVRQDGRGIDDENLPYIINPFDAIALEEALRLQESLTGDIEIIAVGIGFDDYESELRTALAMGANRAILVRTRELLDPWNAAIVLAAVVERECPRLVLMGKQAVDDDSNQAGQFLAALLNWPQATFASSVEFMENRVRVMRETDTGIESVIVDLPAVITTDLRLNEPRYASLPSILKAKKKTIDCIDISDLGIEIQPRIRIVHMESTSVERTCEMLGSVDELTERIKSQLNASKGLA